MRKLITTIAFTLLVALASLAAAQIETGPPSPEQLQRALDEAPGPWAEDAIELVVSQGLYIGYPDGSFGWRDNISRAEFAVVLARLISAYGLDSFSEGEVEVLRNAAEELRGELSSVLGRVDSQQQEIEELRSTQAALESMVMAFEGFDVEADLQAFNDRLAAIEDAVEGVRAQLDTLPAAPEAPPEPTDPDMTGLGDLEARLGAVEDDRARLSDELASLRSEQQGLEARVAALEGQAQQPLPPAEDGTGEEIVVTPEEDPTMTMVNELRGRVDSLEARLQAAEDGLAAARQDIADHTLRIDRLERSVLPERAAFYVNVAVYGTDPDFDLFAKATLGHDSLLGAVGARVSFEYSLGTLPHNVSAALTYRTSFGATDGYFGLGGGVTLDEPMAPFGEILAGMNVRMLRNIGLNFEGRYRPFFDGTTPASAGFGAGVSVRF